MTKPKNIPDELKAQLDVCKQLYRLGAVQVTVGPITALFATPYQAPKDKEERVRVSSYFGVDEAEADQAGTEEGSPRDRARRELDDIIADTVG